MLRGLFCGVIVVLAVSGCGESRPAATTADPPKKPNRTEPQKLDIKPVEVKANEFDSVDAALLELEQVLKLPSGEERNRAEIRVQSWLTMQQDKAAPSVAKRAGDPQESLEMRITACRILGKLGPTGTETLVTIAKQGESSQLRRKAIQTLGLMPANKEAIAELITMLDEPDTQILGEVIDALKRFGTAAKDAAGKLNTLRKAHAEEQIRVASGQALKKVDPRVTFVD
jgi:HEAT repeat protein